MLFFGMFLRESAPTAAKNRTKGPFKCYDLSEFGNTFINCEHTDPNSAWNMFKIELNRLSSLHIPTKMCKSRCDLPWITPHLSLD